MSLPELAGSYALALVRHGEEMPQAGAGQAAGEADFLSIARREAAETLRTGTLTGELVAAAVRTKPGMVMQKFHNLAGGEVPHRFYELVGTGKHRTVRLTPELARIAGSEQLSTLIGEIDARWRIVETSFSAGIDASLIADGLSVDLERSVLTDKLRRRSVTGVTEAVIGFQHGRCLLCDEVITPGDEVAVDHVFPFSLMNGGFPLGSRTKCSEILRTICGSRDQLGL